MATTYTLISSNTLSSDTASVTFSSIPSTYTDLVLRVSARTTDTVDYGSLFLTFNSISSGYSSTILYGVAGTAGSSRTSAATSISLSNVVDGANATTNTFSNLEIYIPSYNVSQNKPISAFGVTENNDANFANTNATAGLMSNTAAITGVTATMGGGSNFKSGSSFYLYGIKNS